NKKIIGVVVTHFHTDCLGGLSAFHDKNIPSYACAKTIELAKEKNLTIPSESFEINMELKLGSGKVMLSYPGPGHTVDNIVGYFPKDHSLFGGCLVKALGAGKGNLEDAVVNEWSKSVRKLKEEFSGVKLVIPGHGDLGGPGLLDYTIEKFRLDQEEK
ncbi:MAG: MBL fold metallo-hydrolase, partial [Saprospiraceae bacterium]|nr:MBL fold metallo-hydrolase [Saprospiraceae bacterium]